MIVSLTRHELESGGSRVRTDDALDDAFRVPVVLRTVGGIDLVAQVVRFDEENVLVDAAGVDVGFVAPGRRGTMSWAATLDQVEPARA